jgi:hypothetical protein
MYASTSNCTEHACLSACTVAKMLTTSIQVPSVEWRFVENANVKMLRDSTPLRRAALKYARATNRVPFFSQPPALNPTRPRLNLFGRTVQVAGTSTGQQASGAARRASTSRRSSGGRSIRGVDSRDDDQDEAHAGAAQQTRACSICDRLRNATAQAVVVAHTLLGDPEVTSLPSLALATVCCCT